MEPISAIVISLALGASAIAGDEVIRLGIRDAYDELKSLISRRYPQVSINPIEQDPASKARRDVVEKDLIAAGANQDMTLAAAARALINLVQKQEPAAAQAIGVDLSDVSAANLRLVDIIASGTSVKVQRSAFSGDIDIRGVRAGMSPVDRKAD